MKKRVNLTPSIPVHICLHFSFTIMRQVKAYVIKNHLDLAFEEVWIGLVHYSWFHLLSTSTAKPILHWSVRYHYLCQDVMSWDTRIKHWCVEACSEQLLKTHKVSRWYSLCSLMMQIYSYQKLLRINAVKQETSSSLWKFILLLKNITGHRKLGYYL